MNRREFFGSLALGGLALVGAGSMLNLLTASSEDSPPIEWTRLEPDGARMVFRFYKGPDYTTLEEALPYLQDVVDKATTWCAPDETFCNRVVMLQSVTFGGKLKKGLDKT
jgi:hypothetical protein